MMNREKYMIEGLLKELKMNGGLKYLKESKEDLNDGEKLLGILHSELEWRKINSCATRIKNAGYPTNKELVEIDEKINSDIPFGKIKKYCDGNFLKEGKNLCFIGAPGLGKTHSLIAIGRELCRRGFTVKFHTAIGLVNLLTEAQNENTKTKLMKKLLRSNFLIIDELGYVPLSDNNARLLFEVFSNRYERGSIGVSSNLIFSKWGEVFGSVELTTALIDRLTHNCDTLYFKGVSYRVLQNKQKNPKSINQHSTLN
jgi:DNA replication protein DnaC